MKIKEIKGRVLNVPRFPYRWRDGFPRAPAERDAFLLQVIAENGVEGHCIVTRRGEELGRQTASLLKPLMVGENALDREKIWQRLWDVGRMGTGIVEALGAFDVALWDLAAKAAGVPDTREAKWDYYIQQVVTNLHMCLCFSPVGLSAMTRLSVSSMVGLVMGTWFLAMAAGNFIAGLIARATGSGESGDVTQVLDVYTKIGWFAVIVGGVVLLVSPFVTRMMHLDTISSNGEDQA